MLNLHWEEKFEGWLLGFQEYQLGFCIEREKQNLLGFFPLSLSLSLPLSLSLSRLFISTTKACNNLDVSKNHQDLLSCIARYTLELVAIPWKLGVDLFAQFALGGRVRTLVFGLEEKNQVCWGFLDWGCSG